MARDEDADHNDLSGQEKEGIGLLWIQLLGIFACLVIFLVIALLVF